MVSASDSQSGSPWFESRSLHCSRSSRVQTLVNSQVVASYQSCYIVFELFVSKYLNGVPVNQLDKLSVLCVINKPLKLFHFGKL